MKQKTHIIIGNGEVGNSLSKVIKADIFDLKLKPKNLKEKYDVMHICFPYSNKFVSYVKKYQKSFKSKLTIIHSTVPIGTSRKCNAVHSPIRGIHPHLEKGIKTFVKYFGGKDARKAAQTFPYIKTKCFKKQESTEALKLWDTTQYGWMVVLQKEIYKWCKKHKLNFDEVYTHPNETYNEGYITLSKPSVVRPHLKQRNGKIGGHCIIPNAELLNEFISRTIIKYNSKL